MLSSCAGIIGNRGQSNYAAGSTFQDALASSKFPHIKSIVTLDLGMIYGAGYISERPEVAQDLEAQGYMPVPLNEFLALLEFNMRPENIAAGSRQLIIGTEPLVELEGSQSIYDNQFAIRDSKFRHIRRRYLDGTAKVSEKKAESVETLLREAKSAEQVRQVVTEAICKKISAQTLVDIEKIGHSDSPADLGLDSLIAVELRNWISQTFDSSLKLTDILKSSSITSLAATVHGQSTFLSELPTMSESDAMESSTPATSDMEVQNNPEELPPVPLPDLSETIQKYLQSLQPLISPEEFQSSSSIARKFESQDGEGWQLQKRLQERAQSAEHRDWLYNIYIDSMYFDLRDALMYTSSYFGSHPISKRQFSAAEKAAVISSAVYGFKLLWDEGRLPPSKMNDEVVCMDSYRWLFNSCRIPGSQADYPQKWPARDFLVAIRKGHMFKMPLRVNGKVASISQLKRGFEEIMEVVNQSAPEAADVGALTSHPRDIWFEVSLLLPIFTLLFENLQTSFRVARLCLRRAR